VVASDRELIDAAIGHVIESGRSPKRHGQLIDDHAYVELHQQRALGKRWQRQDNVPRLELWTLVSACICATGGTARGAISLAETHKPPPA
jgi:hypothetical protein